MAEKKKKLDAAKDDYPGKVKINTTAIDTKTGLLQSPETTALAQARARVAGNVPLPPETQFERDVKAKAIEQSITSPITQEQAIRKPVEDKLTQIQPSAMPTIQQMQQEAPMNNNKYKQLSEKVISDVNAQEGTLQGILPRSARITLRTAGVAVQEAVSPGQLVELWDTTKKLFTQKKPLKYTNALEGLNARMETIRINIANAKAGQPYYDAEDDLRLAVDDLSRVQEATKGIGKLNPNWLVDDGFSIQAEIENKQGELEDLRADLEYIKQSQRTAQANAAFR